MVRWVVAVSLIFFTSISLADVNSNVANCLSSAATAPGAKATCVQAAIAAEETNQITTLFQTYSNFVNQEINNNSFGTAPSGSNRSAIPASSAPASSIFAPKVSPGQSQQQAAPPPPVSQPPKQTPQGGIQYY